MSREYAFYLFDLDGTIVDVEPAYIQRVISQVGDRLDYEFSPTQAEKLWHGLEGSPNEHLTQWGIDAKAFWQAFHDIEDPTKRARHTFLYDDAEIIAELSEPVGIVTHCQSYLTGPVLEQLAIRDWFDVVVCCNDDLGWKPDPRPVRYAMTELGVDDSEPGVLVGDSPQDIGAAWNTGLEAVHVERHGHERRGCCIRADHRVRACDTLFPDAGTA